MSAVHTQLHRNIVFVQLCVHDYIGQLKCVWLKSLSKSRGLCQRRPWLKESTFIYLF